MTETQGLKCPVPITISARPKTKTDMPVSVRASAPRPDTASTVCPSAIRSPPTSIERCVPEHAVGDPAADDREQVRDARVPAVEEARVGARPAAARVHEAGCVGRRMRRLHEVEDEQRRASRSTRSAPTSRRGRAGTGRRDGRGSSSGAARLPRRRVPAQVRQRKRAFDCRARTGVSTSVVLIDLSREQTALRDELRAYFRGSSRPSTRPSSPSARAAARSTCRRSARWAPTAGSASAGRRSTAARAARRSSSSSSSTRRCAPASCCRR